MRDNSLKITPPLSPADSRRTPWRTTHFHHQRRRPPLDSIVMPLPPPAPLPRLSVRPQPQPSNPVIFGSVRAAAIAARHLRQARLNKLKQYDGGHVRMAAPTGPPPLREKRHLNLHLNLDEMEKPKVPPMFAAAPIVQYSDPVRPSDEMPWQAMEDEDDSFAARQRRRQSSVKLSLNSPEGAGFEQFANDGPEQLGKLTKRVKRLGKGAGGTVFLSLYLPSLKLVAVKEVVVYKERVREMMKHELQALHENLMPIETRIEENSGIWSGLRQCLSNIGHASSPSASNCACQYLVGFYGAYLLPARCVISIVMEFMDMGSLQDLLDANISIPEPVLRHCAFCCMKALENMHSHRMIHRDIKPANILMNSHGDFKIADFGLAETLSKTDSFFAEFEGTMMYMAPERIQGHQYSYVSDLWSMGVSLFYLATGAYPFSVEEGFFGLEETIVNEPLPPMPNRFTPECRDFIKALLRRNPNERMTVTQALEHVFLRSYESSASFKSFPELWRKMPLRTTAVASGDVATIAELIADYTTRHQRRHSRRTSRRVSRAQPQPATFLGQFSHMFSHGDATTVDADRQQRQQLERLAADCGADFNELRSLVERAIARQ